MATEAILSLSLRSEAIRGMCKGVRVRRAGLNSI